MECRLERGNRIAPELENKTAQWDPPDDALREEVMALWSRYLLSPHEYKNPWGWTAVGRCFSGCRQPGPKPDRIPAGWEEFCREFCRICMESGWVGYPSDDEMERICMMARMEHAMGDE